MTICNFINALIKSWEIEIKHKNTFSSITLSCPNRAAACFIYWCSCIDCTSFLTSMYLWVNTSGVFISFFPKTIDTFIKLIDCRIFFHERWNYKKILWPITIFLHKFFIHYHQCVNSISNTYSITTILYTFHFWQQFVFKTLYILLCDVIYYFLYKHIL